MAATAHLIHGFVGAGKTTFARRLEEHTGAVRFTHDEWMHRLYGPNPAEDEFFELYDRVDALIWELALKLLRYGTDVILDSGFWSRQKRDASREAVESAGARPVLYWIQTPLELMRERTEERSRSVPENSLWINAPAFDSFLDRFEELEHDETFIAIDGTADASELVERIRSLA
jgi:predicted kinase